MNSQRERIQWQLEFHLKILDEERNVFVYNIFCGDEYININGYGTQKEPLPDVMLEEITATWNNLQERRKNGKRFII